MLKGLVYGFYEREGYGVIKIGCRRVWGFKCFCFIDFCRVDMFIIFGVLSLRVLTRKCAYKPTGLVRKMSSNPKV